MAKEKDVDLKVRPLDDRVVVQPLEAEDKSAGGILLPDAAKQKPQRGRVLAVGPGNLRDDGHRTPVSVSKGDEVVYGRYAGNDIEVDGKKSRFFAKAIFLPRLPSKFEHPLREIFINGKATSLH